MRPVRVVGVFRKCVNHFLALWRLFESSPNSRPSASASIFPIDGRADGGASLVRAGHQFATDLVDFIGPSSINSSSANPGDQVWLVRAKLSRCLESAKPLQRFWSDSPKLFPKGSVLREQRDDLAQNFSSSSRIIVRDKRGMTDGEVGVVGMPLPQPQPQRFHRLENLWNCSRIRMHGWGLRSR